MATITTNLKIPKPDGNEYFNKTEFNKILDVIDQNAASKKDVENIDTSTLATKEEFTTHKNDYVKHPAVVTATNSDNAYSVTLDPAPPAYANGMGLILTINADSTGASTINVNDLGAIPIKKANGNDVTNLKKNGVYTLRYSKAQSAFILQGEGGEYGTAIASDVLDGKTIGTENGLVTGTMPNRGAFNLALGASVPPGYYSGGRVPSGKRYATGTIPRSTSQMWNSTIPVTVSSLTFKPSTVLVHFNPATSYRLAEIQSPNIGLNLRVDDYSKSSTSGISLTRNGFTGNLVHSSSYGEIESYTWIAYE